MKRQLIFTFLFLSSITGIFCLSTPKAVSREESEWFPFVLNKRLNLNSPANIGKLTLDAPAGKHGFVTAKDSHFYFEDGTRAKFWGTNLCFSACFPSKKQAKMIAERLAFFGFNAVRLHHMDFYFEPRGIFEDICPAYKHSQLKKTGHLSKRQLDKLDYLIYQLKQHGIYININLLVSRHFTEADGVKDVDKLGMAAKPVSMFDPKLIELQKKYAKDLLTHYNPYTKLCYCDDPAIAFVEITNENSLIGFWKRDKLNNFPPYTSKNPIPQYYIEELDKMWNEWLKNKYKTPQKVIKSWGLNTLELKEKTIVTEDSDWKIEKHKTANCKKETENGYTMLTVTKITPVSWHLQYRKTQIPLNKGKNYLLEFTAFADRNLKIAVVCQQAFSPWKNLGLWKEITLTKTPKKYKIPFTALNDCPNSKIGFIIGYQKRKIFLKDIKLKEINTLDFIISQRELKEFKFQRPIYSLLRIYPERMQQDIKEFYIYLEKKYFKEMTEFLRKECNVKVPITGIGGVSNKEDIEAQIEFVDFIDFHTYWDHPHFPHKPWDRNDFRIHNKSLLLHKNLGIIGSILKRQSLVKNKPLTITEWSHCYPNEFAYETPGLLASFAVKNNWCALFKFAFSHGWKFSPVLDNIQSYFDIIANPQQLILCGVASFVFFNADSENSKTEIKDGVFILDHPKIKGVAGFIKNKEFNFGFLKIKSDENGAIFIFSAENKPLKESKKLILAFVSKVKNKNSGWKNPESFEWGSSPVMLKKMNVEIWLKTNKNLKVYELNNKSERNRQIKIEKENSFLKFSTKNSKTVWFEIESVD